MSEMATSETSAARARGGGRRALPAGLAIVALMIAANHALPLLLEQRGRSDGAGVVVRSEKGFLAGHNTIGIEETQDAGSDMLRFRTLGLWDWSPVTPTPCPAAVEAWDGREASCVGFMYPLETSATLRSFCLLRTTQTCCFGPRPQYNQYVLVEMARPVKFERFKPVIVKGAFHVDPEPEEGYIYRMDGDSVKPVVGEEPDRDPCEAAREAGLPLFDFSAIARLKGAEDKLLPDDVLALDGRRAVVAGYFLDRAEDPPRILVARSYWDGATQGEAPNVYNAVMVYLRSASEMPPVWKQVGFVAGTLRVERDPRSWPSSGIVSVGSALCGKCVEPARRPPLNLWQEVLAAVAILGVSLRLGGGRSRRETATLR